MKLKGLGGRETLFVWKRKTSIQSSYLTPSDMHRVCVYIYVYVSVCDG